VCNKMRPLRIIILWFPDNWSIASIIYAGRFTLTLIDSCVYYVWNRKFAWWKGCSTRWPHTGRKFPFYNKDFPLSVGSRLCRPFTIQVKKKRIIITLYTGKYSKPKRSVDLIADRCCILLYYNMYMVFYRYRVHII